MMEKVKKIMQYLSVALVDDNKRAKVIGDTVYGVLSIVALVMTLVNIFTNQQISLTICTGIFCACNIINLFISSHGIKGVRLASFFISVEFYVMFLYFLIWGIPDGFSAIWIGLLPPVSMLFYGWKKGSIVSGSMMVVLIVILWTPLGNLLLQHDFFSATFKMRFPLLYFAFYAMAVLLEVLRMFASNEAKRLSDIYRESSIKDQLTQVYNRNGLLENVGKQLKKGCDKIGFAILDIDDFKHVNDTYGHLTGDKVLVDFAQNISKTLNATVSRWGGEEFAIIFYNGSVSEEDFKTLLHKIEVYDFQYGDNAPFHVTASIGVFEPDKVISKDQLDACMLKADNALYGAKNTGKNKVVYYQEK